MTVPPPNFPQPTRRRVLTGALATLSLPLLAACSSNDVLADQAGNAGNKNYIAGDGSVMEIAADQRGAPVKFTSTLFDGTPVDTADWQGAPVLLNFWYAACAPCRVEAPDLAALHAEFGEEIAFFGVNVRDAPPTAQAFERNFGIEYPSMEEQSGAVLLAMGDYVSPQAVPTTLVLDRKTRVAARILGIADHSTLRSLLTSALTEDL